MDNKKICGVPFSCYMLSVDICNTSKIISRVCCPAWLKPPYSTLKVPAPENESGFINLDSIWNSDMMVAFRKSIADGSYSFCNTEICPSYISDDLSPLPDRARELIEQGVYEMDYPPLRTQANIDQACNLSCPSCRVYPISAPNPKSYQRLKSLLSSGVEGVLLNGAGEIFKNQYLLRAMNEITKELYPNLKSVTILTNGTLLNKTMWMSLSDSFKSVIKDIYVSVDAASEQTYKKVRVGGNFNRLVDNLMHMGILRKENKIINFSISIVLQKANIHELIDFLKLALQVGASSAAISRIEDWHAHPRQEFLDNMALPDNWKVVYKDQIEEAKAFAKDNNLYLFSNI